MNFIFRKTVLLFLSFFIIVFLIHPSARGGTKIKTQSASNEMKVLMYLFLNAVTEEKQIVVSDQMSEESADALLLRMKLGKLEDLSKLIQDRKATFRGADLEILNEMKKILRQFIASIQGDQPYPIQTIFPSIVALFEDYERKNPHDKNVQMMTPLFLSHLSNTAKNLKMNEQAEKLINEAYIKATLLPGLYPEEGSALEVAGIVSLAKNPNSDEGKTLLKKCLNLDPTNQNCRDTLEGLGKDKSFSCSGSQIEPTFSFYAARDASDSQFVEKVVFNGQILYIPKKPALVAKNIHKIIFSSEKQSTSILFTSDGARKLKELTEGQVGKNVVLRTSQHLLSAPIIREAVSKG
ncbi:MAG: hypothetical protein JNK65_08830, partial [Deltaproteobacteria bacterium]|nr:hypothetical protein [Deltaproteobacteria bacterium]